MTISAGEHSPRVGQTSPDYSVPPKVSGSSPAALPMVLKIAEGSLDASLGPLTGPTIEQAQTSGAAKRPLWKAALLALPLVALGWLATLAGVALVADAAPARFVLFAEAELLEAFPEAALVGAGPVWVTLASGDPGFTRALYRAGALLVLPAGLEGCVPFRPAT